jgi:competence protein ComFC
MDNFMLDRIYSSLFPQKCVSCGLTLSFNLKQPDHYFICRKCFDEVIPIRGLEGIKCRRCGAFLYRANTDLCYHCSSNKDYFHKNTSLFYYKEPVIKELMHRFKFESNILAGKTVSQLLINELKYFLENNHYDERIVTPLSPDRMRKRGFNQVEFVLRKCDIASMNIIFREKHKKHQSELSADDRRELIKGQFYIKESNIPDIRDKTLLIIDDIFTTGSTINELSRILMENGAKTVDALTFFRD